MKNRISTGMVINNKFNIGDTVYIKTDVEQSPGIITCIQVNPGDLLYTVSRNSSNGNFYDFELSYDRDILISIN